MNVAWMLLLNAALFAVPVVLAAVILYWIIRLGVKHGLRSYYAQANQGPTTASPAPQPDRLG